MALFGSIETVRAQSPDTPAFAKAWEYLEQLGRAGSPVHERVAALKAGESQKHELGGGAFVIEQAYETKARADGFFESHRKYVDVQVLVSGEEMMEVADLSRCSVREAYQEARDLVVFHDVAGASQLRLKAGEAAVFFPEDIHMPSLRPGGTATLVRKAVLKLPVAE